MGPRDDCRFLCTAAKKQRRCLDRPSVSKAFEAVAQSLMTRGYRRPGPGPPRPAFAMLAPVVRPAPAAVQVAARPNLWVWSLTRLWVAMSSRHSVRTAERPRR